MLVTQGFRGYSFSLIVIIVLKTKAIFIETFLMVQKKEAALSGQLLFCFNSQDYLLLHDIHPACCAEVAIGQRVEVDA